MQPNGPRGTPLFTSINNSRGGGMYFSDDISALGYMVASLVLGKLPWEDCKSEEEIQRMKEEMVGLLGQRAIDDMQDRIDDG